MLRVLILQARAATRAAREWAPRRSHEGWKGVMTARARVRACCQRGRRTWYELRPSKGCEGRMGGGSTTRRSGRSCARYVSWTGDRVQSQRVHEISMAERSAVLPRSDMGLQGHVKHERHVLI